MTIITYRQARLIVLGFGTALIAGVTLSAWFRGADPYEAIAIALFLPVLVGLAYGGTRWGVAVGAVVSVVYVVMRFATLPQELEAAEFIPTAIVRVLLYLGLGLFGGWSNEMLEQSLRKLELYDDIDDDTGVGNTRAMLSFTDREVARARRYGSIFSLTVLHIERDVFNQVSEKKGRRALRDLCQSIDTSVRTTDLVSRVPLESREDVVVMLPETGSEGARIFLDRLIPGSRELLGREGIQANGEVTGTMFTLPGDEDRFARYQHELVAALQVSGVTVDDTPDEDTL
ncbi:MAG TPA: diguanylate cyclase [Nitriliruptorales bacterium]